MSSEMVCKMPRIMQEFGVRRNPELEKLRNEVFDSLEEDERNAKELANELKPIHAGYLFHERGRLALASICQVISSTPKCSSLTTSSSWKDLAYELGLSYHKIGCIENRNTNSSDYTETVLMCYSQMVDATLDRVILALSKLQRFDAITMSRAHLKDMIKFARREQVARTEENNRYYSCNGLESEEPTPDGILRPCGRKHLVHQLPITLRNFDAILDECITNSENKSEDSHQQATVISRPNVTRKWSKCVLLTFAKDGEKIGFKIAAELRKQRAQYLPIGVLILDENFEVVQSNPVHFITHYFSKVDYVIAIITPNYLKSIEMDEEPTERLSSTIDTRYVKLIYTLSYNYYVGNSCRNDKFRAIIPEEYENDVINSERMKTDILLQSYVRQSKLETLALRIIKYKKKTKHK
ncbi:hypothetical protein O3M35_005975 [Rhynocoris fuscipes]|uniref:Death domain-containing protein n=1 Tax=Rhynocoris fuscipes TaxID=488301 RepID=A0AAW1DBS7_9HEMI